MAAQRDPRTCVVCLVEFIPSRAQSITCGAAPCQRENRRRKCARNDQLRRQVRVPVMTAPHVKAQRAVRDSVERHMIGGMDASEALVATAFKLGIPVAQVMSTWKAVTA